MGLADQDAEAGWCELKTTEGEELCFRGAKVTAVVNFPDMKELLERGEVNFEDKQKADVRLDNAAATPPPKAGETFRDGDKRWFSVDRVRMVGREWVCTCSVAYSEREFLQR